MDELASCMGGSGNHVAFVGHTTARSHMRWATAAYDRAKAKPGYRNLKAIPGTPHGLAGSGWITTDRSNVKQYPF